MALRWLCSTLCVVALGSSLGAQPVWTLRGYGGLGIGVASLPALADYANLVGGPTRDGRISDLQTLFELNAGVEYAIDAEWSIGIDYVSVSRTIQTAPSSPGAGWEFEPSVRMPAIVIRRLYPQDNLTYGLGAGVGYHTGRLVQRFPASGAVDTFDGAGPGFLLQGVAYTRFDEHLSGMIAVDLRVSLVGPMTNSAGRGPVYAGSTASLKTLAVALRFGLSYQR